MLVLGIVLLPRQRDRADRRQRDQVRDPRGAAEPPQARRRFPALAIGAAMQREGMSSSTKSSGSCFTKTRREAARLWDQVVDYWPRSRRIFDDDIPRFVHAQNADRGAAAAHLGYYGTVECPSITVRTPPRHSLPRRSSAPSSSPSTGSANTRPRRASRRGQQADQTAARSTSRIRLACSIRSSPSISASRSTRANTRSWGSRPMAGRAISTSCSGRS